MKYLDFKETMSHSAQDFPFALYKVTSSHPNFHMMHHWHTEYEIIRVISGTFLLYLNNNKEYVLHSGDAAFISDGTLHGGKPTDNNCIYECLVFDMRALLQENNCCKKELLSIINGEKMIWYCFYAHLHDIHTILRIIFTCMEDKGKGYMFQVQGAMYYFLGLIIEHNYFKTASEINTKERKKLLQFKNVITYIEANYQKDITLETLSKQCNMNTNYFCKAFKEITQKTPIDYLNNYRVECACEQILYTDRNLTEIAYHCGFNDFSYFIKVFKKYKGVTPSKYC